MVAHYSAVSVLLEKERRFKNMLSYKTAFSTVDRYIDMTVYKHSVGLDARKHTYTQ